ncbi:Ig-like domain-containing protein [Streptomyces sp. NPDC006971]|uniref:Ig-like domain-containing protein n=1 Tax=Streptomyces sp. NPDC006971 TaxID=3154784 RepID=UPI0033C38AB3
MSVRHWQGLRFWKTALFTALAAVIALGTPAAAQDLSTTTVVASPTTTAVGSPVTLTATISCPEDPSGGLGVTFFDGPDLLATVPVGSNGVAVYSATFATEGAHAITAAYNGNDVCAASNDETTVMVSSTPTPPTTPAGWCAFVCGSLINFTVGDMNNNVVVH